MQQVIEWKIGDCQSPVTCKLGSMLNNRTRQEVAIVEVAIVHVAASQAVLRRGAHHGSRLHSPTSSDFI